MLLERVEAEGLAHNSYLVGDGDSALVIDPRRDCRVYVEKAAAAGMRITQIVETHRNEDYVIGSVELAERTGAEIWHADAQWDYQYGRPAEAGQRWKVGGLSLEAMHTPGHTPGSMSYLLLDASQEPWMVFTGDALFAGDVGRVDFLGMDRAEEMAGLLYDALYDKILPLGDGVIVCPAHGAGSVCGSSIAQRTWTTIGLEKRLNARLQYDTREQFIKSVAKEMERPPYFRRMERLNLEGAPLLHHVPLPPLLSPRDFAELANTGFVLDVRSELAFSAGHVPGATSIYRGRLASFAGWFVPHTQPLLLVDESPMSQGVVRQLMRMGYDNLSGILSGGMLAWHTAGLDSESTSTLTVQELCERLDEGEEPFILDVRSAEELESGQVIPGAHHIHVTQLSKNLGGIPEERQAYIFCGSGLRSMIAASFLQGSGYRNVAVVLGGLAGWSSLSCPLP